MEAKQPCPLEKKAPANSVCKNQLKKIFPKKSDEQFDEVINSMEKTEINTLDNQTLFLGQLAHESDDLHYTEEIASGEKYEGRADLGNTEEGDGKKFKGRGYIQVTGRDNYQKFADSINDPEIMNDPSLISSKYPTQSAAWFWKKNNLDKLQSYDESSVFQASKKVNGFDATQEEFYEMNSTGKSEGYKNRMYDKTAEKEYISKIEKENLTDYETEEKNKLINGLNEEDLSRKQLKRLKQQAKINAKNRAKIEGKNKYIEDKKNNKIDDKIDKKAKTKSEEKYEHLKKQTDRIRRTSKIKEVLNNKSLCDPTPITKTQTPIP